MRVVKQIPLVGSVQKPSLIPLNPGWFLGIPLLDYEKITNIVYSPIITNQSFNVLEYSRS